MSWILHRVDDRLIHGQVVIAYGARLQPKRIWVADDAAASSPWEGSLLLTAAPGIAIRAQLLDAERPRDLLDVVDQLTFLQLDPTAVIAPAADLVAWSRLGDR